MTTGRVLRRGEGQRGEQGVRLSRVYAAEQSMQRRDLLDLQDQCAVVTLVVSNCLKKLMSHSCPYCPL
jgi:hypothetical protein